MRPHHGAMAQIRLTVVIPTRNRAHMLPETLDSLGDQTLFDFEVIVVCDGADPQTRAISNCYFPEYRLTWIFLEENKGPSYARNLGAFSGHGDLVAFLDDDMTAAPDWVSQHTKHHDAEASERHLVVSGKIGEKYLFSPSSQVEHLLREERVELLRKCESSAAAQGIRSVDTESYALRCFGVNCSIDRTMFLTHGGFDPVLRISEDMEMGHRLFDQGFNFVFEPQAIVHHRETKEQKKYLVQCWTDSGHVDVYRARMKGQQNPQTRALTFVRSKHPLRKLRARLSFGYPMLMKVLAQAFRWSADLTGSRLSFRAWVGLESSANYWEQVSSELTQDSLFQLVGWPFGVLRFRAIDALLEPNEKNYHLSSQTFSRALRWLKALGSRFLPPEMASLGSNVRRGLILSFDGGYEGLWNLLPRLDDLKIAPLVFLVPGLIGKTSVWDAHAGYKPRKLLSITQIREMQDIGVQFGSLGLTHLALPNLSDIDLHREVVGSKSSLEDILGSQVHYFAYPWGAVDARVRAAVARAGFKVAFSGRPGLDHWDDRLSLKRVTVREGDGLARLLIRLVTDEWPAADPPTFIDSQRQLQLRLEAS
jgi:glycosyltransferase involved in cell wall biosynthesis